MIKSGYNDLSESKSWKALETILSHPIANIKGVFFYRIIKSETLEKTGNRLLLVFERHPCINALRAGRDGQTILLIIIVIIIIIIVIIIIITITIIITIR